MPTIFVFGNEDLPQDSIQLRILPELRKRFPNISFLVQDPNEEWDIPAEFLVLDAVEGIEEVRTFDDLTAFASAPRLTMHDFDALTNLRYLQKLGKIKKVKIIGIPPMMSEEKAVEGVATILSSPPYEGGAGGG